MGYRDTSIGIIWYCIKQAILGIIRYYQNYAPP
jgi:hypothetical protein